MNACVCCGAPLVCAETFLCSINGCFLRWLCAHGADDSVRLDQSMAGFVCPAWKRIHNDSDSLEMDS